MMRRKGLRFPSGIPRVMSDNRAETDIAAATVACNGDLRDRIAYALAQADGDEPGMEPASCDYEMADAVIRELGTDCIYRYACHQCGDFWFDKSERMQRFALLHGKAHADD